VTGRVRLARRGLFSDRRRALLSVGGVAVALVLVLVLRGIFAGAIRQVTGYVRNSPADVIVSQRGVRTMHMSSSALPPATVDEVRRTEGVAWVDGIRFVSGGLLQGPKGRQLSYVIGYEPGQRGGPKHVLAGTEPGPGQAVVDEVAARQLGIHLGTIVNVVGTDFRVVGLSAGGTGITNTTTFVDTRDLATLRGPAVSYILVGARHGTDAATLASRIATHLPNVTAQTRSQFVRSEARIATDMSADMLQVMSLIGFVIALAVVTLGLYNTTISRLREYAIVRALGGSTARVARIVLAQALWTVGLALVGGVALAIGLGAIVGRLTPTISIAILPASVANTAMSALTAGVLGAALPLWRVMHVEPATAFRRGT
jgi:putative ABC transport system permease protein